jgi:hypothetical protein
MVHYYTSITSNYIPKARILARSIRKHDPKAVIHLVLCDAPPANYDFAKEPFDELHTLRDLDIPDLESWLFKHDIVELCTAAKGPAMHKLLNRADADQVYFFDPDVVVFGELPALHAELASASVLLTPHQIVPESRPDAVIDNEICSLKHGIYNLGFVGVRKCEAGLAFARWWRDRLLTWCYADIPNGLFTDQRWCDLAPALFADIKVLRDPRFNVATWNLTHRLVTLGANGGLLVEGRPLGFFHFSGFDSGAQKIMLQKYAPIDSPLFELHDWYVREMDKEGQKELGSTPWAYGTYADGSAIPRLHRHVYRMRPDFVAAFPDPFVVDGSSFRAAITREYPSEEALRASNASEQTLFAVTELRNTLAWRIGYAITNPIERVLGRVPGLVPRVKKALGA